MMFQREQIQELMDHYKEFHISRDTDNLCELTGEVHIYGSIKQYVMNSKYSLSIIVPKSYELPYVIDHGGIDEDYQHRYQNGKLCLATDIDIVMSLEKDPSLVNWMKSFVEPYYATYEYYKRYGEFPYGDREHGEYGIIQSYMDIFSVDDRQALCLLNMIVNETYRGHHLCPCESGKKIRNCHGEMVLKFKGQPNLFEQAKKDYQGILERVRDEYTKQQGDSE